MNISPISFKSTFSVNQNELTKKQGRKISSKKDEYQITIEPGGYKNSDKIFLHTPYEYDSRMIKMLSKLKVNFELLCPTDTLNDESITSRIVLSDIDKEAGYKLVIVNTKKLDSELKKDTASYVGKNGENGSRLKYDRFKQYLNTNQPIFAPKVNIRKSSSGEINTNIYDGRHRFAVLRDMGLEKIPVAMDNESIKLAEKINLI